MVQRQQQQRQMEEMRKKYEEDMRYTLTPRASVRGVVQSMFLDAEAEDRRAGIQAAADSREIYARFRAVEHAWGVHWARMIHNRGMGWAERELSDYAQLPALAWRGGRKTNARTVALKPDGTAWIGRDGKPLLLAATPLYEPTLVRGTVAPALRNRRQLSERHRMRMASRPILHLISVLRER
jgi:hypothetical protein